MAAVLKLWKYNKATGNWESCAGHASKVALATMQDHEPKETFTLCARRPTRYPVNR